MKKRRNLTQLEFFNSLTKRQRNIVRMLFLGDLTDEEIAERASCSRRGQAGVANRYLMSKQMLSKYMFSEYGFNQVQKSSVFGAFFRSRKLVSSLVWCGF